MKVLRHDHIAQHNEATLTAHFFENFQKQIAPRCSVEPSFSLITTARDVVQVSASVISLQAARHVPRLDPNPLPAL